MLWKGALLMYACLYAYLLAGWVPHTLCAASKSLIISLIPNRFIAWLSQSDFKWATFPKFECTFGINIEQQTDWRNDIEPTTTLKIAIKKWFEFIIAPNWNTVDGENRNSTVVNSGKLWREQENPKPWRFDIHTENKSNDQRILVSRFVFLL